MIGFIISILVITLTLSILKDTHVKVYKYCAHSPIEEYDLCVTVWQAILIVIIGLIPVVNIIGFITFAAYYIVHATWDPAECLGTTHVCSLNKGNLITEGLLKIRELLCKKI